jgi:hypothetical protein
VALGLCFACGGTENTSDAGADSGVTQPDGGVDAGLPDGEIPDGGMGPATFEDFVLDQINNHTADNTEPVPIPTGLVDTEDPNAFSSLFPP